MVELATAVDQFLAVTAIWGIPQCARRRCVSLENLEASIYAPCPGLTYSLTTGQSSYQIGQPITMTFTETNTGDQPVTVEVSPTDFAAAPAEAAQGATPSWHQSNPENQGATTTPETLQPGQSLSQTATWDGSLPGMAEPGESAGYAYGSYVVTNPNAPQGTTAALTIASPFQDTLTTDQPTYQLGQTIHFTFTRTNTSDEPAVFTSLTFSPYGFDVTQGGQTVQTSFPYVYDGPAIFPIVLRPGQTWSTQGTWDGLEYSIPAGSSGETLPFYSGEGTVQTITGSFDVTYVGDPAVSTNFQIQPSPLTYSLDLSQIGPLSTSGERLFVHDHEHERSARHVQPLARGLHRDQPVRRQQPRLGVGPRRGVPAHDERDAPARPVVDGDGELGPDDLYRAVGPLQCSSISGVTVLGGRRPI